MENIKRFGDTNYSRANFGVTKNLFISSLMKYMFFSFFHFTAYIGYLCF